MPPWTSLEGHMIRVEEHLDKGRYTLRAELPGIPHEGTAARGIRKGSL
ncbi:hypothetical protein [Rhodococcus sp. WB9]|nr:hypothetical protein [Rhodococcus sp. WB9]